MLYLRDFIGTERYKKATYFIYRDYEDNPVDSLISEICPILLWEDQKDGGEKIKLALYHEIPKGYKLWQDAPKAPYGYEWIYNGRSASDGGCIGLLRIKMEE